MALPTVVGVATSSVGAGGTSSCDFSATGRIAGDLLILLDQTPQRAVTTPSGWTQFASSPQGLGSAGASGSVRNSAYWKVSDGTETTVAPSSTSGNHAYVTGIVLRGQDTTTPINVEVGGTLSATASMVCPSVTTTVNNCLIVNLICTSLDAVSSGNISGAANSNLANVTVQQDRTTNLDTGGGCAIITGELATAGSSGTTTGTYISSTNYAMITVGVAGASGGSTTIAGSPGSFSMTGQAATVSQTMAGASGAFSLTGQAATFGLGLVLTGLSGAFTMTGQPATIGRTLVGSAGSFLLNGQTATIVVGQMFACSPGAFTMTGKAVGFNTAQFLQASPGAFLLTGQDAFISTHSSTVLVDGQPGSYLLTGQPGGFSFFPPYIRPQTITLVSDIIRDAYRESNINAIGVAPTASQQDEALRFLNRLVASSYGNEEGDLLQPMPIGRNNTEMPPGFPYYDQTPPGNFTIPPNSRLLLNLEFSQTLYLNPMPEDGERFAVVDVANNLSVCNLTLVGNGRLINGQNSVFVNTNGFSQEYFYRDDLGDWLPILPLAATDNFPYPSDFDDYFIISLAMRLNPRNGAPLDPQSKAAYDRARTGLNSRYQQIRPTPSELALLRTPGTWPYYYRGIGGSAATSIFNSGYGYNTNYPWGY